MTLTVTSVSDAPVALSQNVGVAINVAKAITLVGTDGDNNPLTYTILSQPANGTLTGTAPNVTYTPTTNYSGTASFTFKVNDGTSDSGVATVTLTVNTMAFTWNSAIAGNWSDSTKWASGTGSPASTGQEGYVLNFNATGTYTTTNDLNTGFLLNQLNFGGSIATLAGNGLALSANSTTLPRINQNSSSAVTISAPLNLSADTTVGGSGTGAITLSGILSGTGSLTKTTSGTLTLSGVNTYSGGTVINAGNLTINNNSALGSGPVTVSNGGRLDLGNVVLTKNLTLNGGSLSMGGGNGTGALSGTIVLAANSNIAPNISNGNQIPLSASISGPGGLTSIDRGLLLLTGANTYNGPTVINQGALVFKSSIYGNDTSKWTPANITVASNAVLGMSVGGASDFTMAQAATMFTNLTTDVNNNGMRPNSFMSLDTRNASAGTYTFSSVLTDSSGTGGGAVNFAFSGSSNTTLELTGSNTYSGVTMVRNNGTLRVSSFNSVNGGNPPMASSSLGRPTTVANGTILLGESSWNGNRMPGTTYASGNLTYTGTGETTDRKISLGGYSSTRTYTLDQSGTGLLKFLSNFDQQIANTTHSLVLAGSTTGTGEIAGAIANNNAGFNNLVTKNGTGTWTLFGANTYAGVTTVTGGALVLANATAIPGGIVSTGGLGALTINGGVIGLGVGNFSRPLAAAGTVTGVNFTGNGGWAAYGADRTVNLGGAAASVTWATTNTGLNARTLILGNTTSTHTVDFQNPLDMTNGNRTVQVDNGAAVIDGKLSGALTGIAGGNLIKSGLGTLALTAANGYIGTTTVNAGTLLVNNATGSGTGSGNVSVTVGTLGGSGSISGTVTIGNSTGAADSILAPGNSIGTIATGNLAFNSSGSYAAELNGTSATSDRANVTGTVSINAATTLTVNVAGTLSANQQYVIVSNDDVDAVSGTFAGLAQDAVVVSPGGTDLKISYTGGDGNDIVLYTGASGSPYATWAAGTFTNPFTNTLPSVDFDNDGLSNLLEFVLGGDPTISQAGIAPTVSISGSNLVMTFKRSDASELAPAVTVKVELSNDLSFSTPAGDITIGPVTNAGPIAPSGASYTVTNSAGLDTIVLTIPQAAAPKKFARIKAVKP